MDWDVTQFTMLDRYKHFEKNLTPPVDDNSSLLQNVSNYVANYTVSHL
jgi:hypothetical protein